MRLTREQLLRFQQDGFLILPNLFSPAEVEILRTAMVRVFGQDDPANIREKNSQVVRTAMALHQRDEVFARLARHPRFVEPAQQIAGPDLYIQQVKINVKEAFTGEVWQWHQDFSTHHHDDGVPEPLALNLHVFLDDVNEFNGPLYFVRGSQRFGPAATLHDTTTTSYPLWVVPADAVKNMTAQGEAVEQIEVIAAELAAEIFAARFAEIRVHSGAIRSLKPETASPTPSVFVRVSLASLDVRQ